VPQYDSDVRRWFLFPRYQRDAARLLDAKEQDEMVRHIADDPERHPRIPGRKRYAEGAVGTSRPWETRWRAGDLLLRRFGLGVLHRRICEEREGESQ
jgi:hypothetical protein